MLEQVIEGTGTLSEVRAEDLTAAPATESTRFVMRSGGLANVEASCAGRASRILRHDDTAGSRFVDQRRRAPDRENTHSPTEDDASLVMSLRCAGRRRAVVRALDAAYWTPHPHKGSRASGPAPRHSEAGTPVDQGRASSRASALSPALGDRMLEATLLDPRHLHMRSSSRTNSRSTKSVVRRQMKAALAIWRWWSGKRMPVTWMS